MAVAAQVVTVNEDAAASAADLTLDRIVLDEVRSRFAGINIDIAGAVIDATQDDDLDGGVSEITLTLRDPYNAILESGILDREEDGLLNAIDLDLGTDPDYGRLIFRLIGYDDDGHGGLTLKFEPRTVALMRRHRSRRRWRRGTVTRAEVIQAQTREVKATRIRFVSEELHKRQPLAKRTTSKAAKAGFADGAKVTWTGKTGKAEHPSAGQVANLEEALQEGQRQKAPTRVLVATAMAVIQESRGRTEATNGDHVGLFQQSRAMGWPATRDPTKDAAAFVSRAITANRANPTLGLADLVERVQRSGQPDEYRQWEDSARRIVKAFNGGQLAGTGGSSEGAFTFYRGAPGQPLEDAWACSLRLANDVRWRLFPIGETIRYDSDETLLGAKPVATLDPGDAPVEAMPFSWDARRRVNEMTVTVRVTRFALRVGQVVDVVNRGPANGRWLISKRSRSYFNSTATLTLRQPQPQRSEPREDQSQSGTGTGIGASARARRSSAGYSRPPSTSAPRAAPTSTAAATRPSTRSRRPRGWTARAPSVSCSSARGSSGRTWRRCPAGSPATGACPARAAR
jgi:hypothetical protein